MFHRYCSDFNYVESGTILILLKLEPSLSRGLAGTLAKRFPRWRKSIESSTEDVVSGSYHIEYVTDKLKVVSIFCIDPVGELSYQDLDFCLYSLKEYNVTRSFILPFMVGCRHSDGNWEEVKKIIYNYFPYSVELIKENLMKEGRN